MAANWDARDPDQRRVARRRVFRLRRATVTAGEGPDGKPSVLGAGGLAFRCVDPFNTWTMTYDGKAVQTSSEDLVAGKSDGPLVDVCFHVEATMAVPPWVQGALRRDAAEQIKTSVEGDLMGGPRYEQLFRATGSVSVAGDAGLHRKRPANPSAGSPQARGFLGSRVAVSGVPQWQGIRLIAYPPRPDGEPTFNEGYIFSGDGPLIPARVIEKRHG